MKISKNKIFRLLLALYLFSLLWWILYFPYDAGLLYVPIPQDAVFISEHENLPGRMDRILRNPVVMKALEDLDADQVELMIRWKARLLSRFLLGGKTVFARAENVTGINGPVYIASSWIGNRSIPCRIFLAFAGNGNFRRELARGTVPVWIPAGKEGSDPGGMKLSFAVYDGVAIACLSRSASAILHVAGQMIPRINREIPFMSRLLNDRMGIAVAGERGGRTYSDIFSTQWMVKGRSQREFVSFCANLGDIDAFAGELRSSLSLHGSGKVSGKQAEDIASILCGREDGIVLLPLSATADAMTWFDCPEEVIFMAEKIIRMAGEGSPLFVAMFGGERAGKIFDMPVPAFITGVKLRSGDDWTGQVRDLIDDVNIRLRTSFIPCQKQAGEVELVAVESSKAGNFQLFKKGEGMAFARIGEYLLFTSNEKVLFELCSVPGSAGAGASPWLDRVVDVDGGSRGLAWLDLGVEGGDTSFGQTLKDGLNVWKLIIGVQEQTDRSRRVRKNLDFSEKVLEALHPLRAMAFEVDPREGMLEGPLVTGQNVSRVSGGRSGARERI